MYDKRILFESADGPDSLMLYTSEDESVIDWAGDGNALYLTASVGGAFIKMGPFLKQIRFDLENTLKGVEDGRDSSDQKIGV